MKMKMISSFTSPPAPSPPTSLPRPLPLCVENFIQKEEFLSNLRRQGPPDPGGPQIANNRHLWLDGEVVGGGDNGVETNVLHDGYCTDQCGQSDGAI